MPTIDITANDARIQYTASAGQTAFVYDFIIFDESDIIVNKNGTVLTLTTDYTVSGVENASGGTVTLTTGATLNDVITLSRDSTISRTSQYQVDGRLDAGPLERDLDRVFTILQEQERDIDRAVTVSFEDSGSAPSISGSLVADKFLKLDAGGTEIVSSDVDAADASALVGISADITTVAGIDSDVTAVATDITNVNTVAGDIANVNTVAGSIANVNAVAADATDIGTVATDITNVNTVAASIASVVEAAEAVASALAFTFDSSTTMADPSTGNIRLNNAALASTTAIAIDALTAQTGNPDLSDFIATWDDSTNPSNKGFIRLTKGGAPENFVIFEISAVTDNTGWLQLTVSHVDSNGSFSASDTLYLIFTRTGDQGSVSASSNNDFTGDNTFAGKTAFKDDGELTIASGSITITGTDHTVDTESDAATDDLDTINGGSDGEILIIRAANAARDIVVKHGTGNINTADGNDITLDETRKQVLLKYDAELTAWNVISAPSSGGGAGMAFGDNLVSGRYYPGLGGIQSSSTFTIAANTLYYFPYIPCHSVNVMDAIVFEVTTLAAGSVRIGLFEIVDGEPDNLIEDCGAVSVLLTGVKVATFATTQTIDPAKAYAIGFVSDVTPTLRQKSMTGAAGIFQLLGLSGTTGGVSAIGWSESYTYGALPANAGTLSFETNLTAGVYLRAN